MYEKLIESSRVCASGYNGNCDRCLFCGMSNDKDGDCYQQLHKAAADAIEDLENKLNLWRQDKISRWIPVEERLPELHEEVLVCNEEYGLSGLGFATAAVWDGTDWIETWDRRAAIHCVSHWMPLPEPPKEET